MKRREPVPGILNGRVIGGGMETTTKRLQRDRTGKGDKVIRTAERKLVVKSFEYHKGGMEEDDGFTAEAREKIERNYNLLKREYGPYIPPARIVPHPKHKDRFLMLQYLIEGAGKRGEPESVFDSYPGDVESDEAKKQLQDLANRLKDNFVRCAHNADGVMPDYAEPNVVFDKNEHVYIFDNSADQRPLKNVGSAVLAWIQILRLEVLADRPITELKADPFYTRMWEFLAEDAADFEEDNPNQYYELLEDWYKHYEDYIPAQGIELNAEV